MDSRPLVDVLRFLSFWSAASLSCGTLEGPQPDARSEASIEENWNKTIKALACLHLFRRRKILVVGDVLAVVVGTSILNSHLKPTPLPRGLS